MRRKMTIKSPSLKRYYSESLNTKSFSEAIFTLDAFEIEDFFIVLTFKKHQDGVSNTN
jgi:hypothetical protein